MTAEAPTDARDITQAVQQAAAKHKVPGIAVGIHVDNHELYDCYGVTSIDNPLPVTPQTLFQIGSTTKTITGLTAMRLVEEDKLALDEPVKTYLPHLEMADDDVANRLTLRHLLNHTGGFDGDYFADFGRGDDALEKCAATLKNLAQITPLGELWSYCNAGFYLVGRLIEVVTGKPYETAVRDLALDPIGLKSSFFFPEEAMVHRFAVGHHVVEDEVKVAVPWPIPRVANPAGGIAASAEDNLRYARFLMGDGSGADGSRVVSEETLRLMQSPLTDAQLDDKIGLAWFSRQIDGLRLVQHGGGTNGQVSAFLFAPDSRFALSILTNADKGEALEEITRWALRRYLGVEEPKPSAQEATAEQLDELTGRYESLATVVEVERDDEGLTLTLRYKPEALAAITVEPPPPLPPMHAVLSNRGRLLLQDGPYKDLECDIVRRNGRVRWLRVGGRLHVRT